MSIGSEATGIMEGKWMERKAEWGKGMEEENLVGALYFGLTKVCFFEGIVVSCQWKVEEKGRMNWEKQRGKLGGRKDCCGYTIIVFLDP